MDAKTAAAALAPAARTALAATFRHMPQAEVDALDTPARRYRRAVLDVETLAECARTAAAHARPSK